MEFKSWKFNKCESEDGTYHWAEFCFSDGTNNSIVKSPLYKEGESDFACLAEDAFLVAGLLKKGLLWQKACRKFRQAS